MQQQCAFTFTDFIFFPQLINFFKFFWHRQRRSSQSYSFFFGNAYALGLPLFRIFLSSVDIESGMIPLIYRESDGVRTYTVADGSKLRRDASELFDDRSVGF